MGSDEMPELLPCPFCGGGEVEIFPCLTGFVACCSSCNLEGAMELYGKTKPEAIKAWNARTPKTKLEESGGVDVEGLKQPEDHGLRADFSKGWINGWNDCIDYLAAQGHLSPAFDVGKVRGFLEDIARGELQGPHPFEEYAKRKAKEALAELGEG